MQPIPAASPASRPGKPPSPNELRTRCYGYKQELHPDWHILVTTTSAITRRLSKQISYVGYRISKRADHAELDNPLRQMDRCPSPLPRYRRSRHHRSLTILSDH